VSGTHPADARRIGARDAALRRLRRLTAVALAGAGALAALFAGLAAKAFPGRSTATVHRTPARSAPAVPPRAVATPPPLVSAGGAAPAPPAQAPAPTPAPPVVVSGGT
jgi:hypothetical protein